MDATNPREVADLVPMVRLLEALGVEANARARRTRCVIHGGSNSTAFAWREDGRWHCFVCGKGGDKIALVRNIKNCNFRESIEFLAALADVQFRARRVSRREIADSQQRRERAERVAWQIADKIALVRRYYTDALHRVERLQRRIGEQLRQARTEAARNLAWKRLARLAPVCTFFFAAWHFVGNTTLDALVRFALVSSTERREFVFAGVAP